MRGPGRCITPDPETQAKILWSASKSWKATKDYLNQRGTKIRVFRVCFRASFLPPFFLHFPPLFPLQALFTLPPLLPSFTSPLLPFLWLPENSDLSENPRVRKIFVRNSGVGNGCTNFMDAWKTCALSAGKTHVHKIPRFRGGGGYFGFGGGGEGRFYFYGRADFSESRYPKDPVVLKILRVVNLLRVVFLLSPCDLLSRRTLCGHTIFLGIKDIFPLREGSAS